MTRSLWLGLLVLTALAGRATAQPERYELGQRLKQFEAAWERQPDPAARKRALAVLPRVSQQFLTLQLGEAGRTLDEARFALESPEPPSDTARWASAVYASPKSRLIDAADRTIRVTVRSMYPVKVTLPRVPIARLGFARGEPVEVPLKSLPLTVEVSVPDEFRIRPHRDRDLDLRFAIIVDGVEISVREMIVSAVRDRDHRLEELRKGAKMVQASSLPEAATFIDRVDLLERLAGGEVPENELPAAFLFDKAESLELMVHLAQERKEGLGYYGPHRGGEDWLSFPTGKNRRTPCRLFVPDGLDPKQPVPLVVALHGAGGSENLFFEGYGAGRIVKECETRGWMLLAPRSGTLFGGIPPVPALVAKLAERYPIDRKRVFLIGHSMGAGQAVELAQQNPGAFAGVALLGGAGRVRKAEAFAELPMFIGVGTQDTLALGGSRSLRKALPGAKRLTYREYPDLEHLVIVREALPDVFAGWDAVAREGK
jgi:predicted esterase